MALRLLASRTAQTAVRRSLLVQQQPALALSRGTPLRNSNTALLGLRTFSSESGSSSSSSGSGSSSSGLALTAVIIAAAGAAAYVYSNQESSDSKSDAGSSSFSKLLKPSVDYQAVYNEVANLLESNPDYDGIGSYGPILVRLAWHASGTYDKTTGTGGSNGAGMRFSAEGGWGANAGLKIARDLLEPVKAKFPEVSHSDLWIIAGIAAVQEMGLPVRVPFRPGRKDYATEVDVKPLPDGLLPDATKGASHLRDIFYRQGFNDQEIVALSGAHVLGKCHRDRSGFYGPWSFSPTTFSNDYFKLLLNEKWSWVPRSWWNWFGIGQYEDAKTKSLMMLPTDMELIRDKEFRKWVELYAADDAKFYEDFAKVRKKLFV